MIRYSVIIPVYEEERSLGALFESLKKTMDALTGGWEVIFVNDGSQDMSLQVLKKLDPQGSRLTIVDFKEHCGKSAALQAGFDRARGEIIITLDADLQNDPEDIPKLLDKLGEGLDVVCGWRCPRNDPWQKIWSANIACAVRRLTAREKIHDLGCAFRAFKKECLKDVRFAKGLHRFFTLIMLKLGYKIGEVKVRHFRRKFGNSKYNIRNRLFAGINDLIVLALFDVRKLMKLGVTYEIREIIEK